MFNNEKQRFSLRKLSVGLASVCIGITFISNKQDTVKADTIDAKTNIVTAQSVDPDVQKADTQKELLKNTDVQADVKQTEQIDKTVPIESQQETHTLIPDNMVFTNIAPDNQLTWKIVNNPNNVTYNLTNTIYKLRLPKFTNYSLHLVKRGTTQNSISFVYTNKTQKLDYVFNLKIQDNRYYLTVCKIDRVNRKIIPIKTYNVISYQDLLQIIAKYFK